MNLIDVLFLLFALAFIAGAVFVSILVVKHFSKSDG